MKQATKFGYFAISMFIACIGEQSIYSMDDGRRTPPPQLSEEPTDETPQKAPQKRARHKEPALRSPEKRGVFSEHPDQIVVSPEQRRLHEAQYLSERLGQHRVAATGVTSQSPYFHKYVSRRTRQPVRLDHLNGIHAQCVTHEHWSRVITMPTERGAYTFYQRDALIDPHLQFNDGTTNLNRMLMGLPPIGPDDEAIELHHLFQQDPGPVAEVTSTFHDREDKALHVRGLGLAKEQRHRFSEIVKIYWQERGKAMRDRLQAHEPAHETTANTAAQADVQLMTALQNVLLNDIQPESVLSVPPPIIVSPQTVIAVTEEDEHFGLPPSMTPLHQAAALQLLSQLH